MDLQQEFGLAYLFISHDLSVVRHIADEVMVMYLGRPVKYGTAEEIFNTPRHPYTRALLSATPTTEPEKRRERIRPDRRAALAAASAEGLRLPSALPLRLRPCDVDQPKLLKAPGGNADVTCFAVQGELL